MEGDRGGCSFCNPTYIFQSTPSVWRETAADLAPNPPFGISIHSLRVEGDWGSAEIKAVQLISIHSLRVEGDLRGLTPLCTTAPFQSTPSVWRETPAIRRTRHNKRNFNPLPPCGGRPEGLQWRSYSGAYFNPLPPCGGRRGSSWRDCSRQYFNPLPPCGGRLRV